MPTHELLIQFRGGSVHRPGEVICACPGGWEWSAAERANPDWRIVRVKGLRVAEVNALTSPGVARSLAQAATGTGLPVRQMAVDHHAIGLDAAGRAEDGIDLEVDGASLMATAGLVRAGDAH